MLSKEAESMIIDEIYNAIMNNGDKLIKLM